MHLNSCYYPREPTAFGCKMCNFAPAPWSPTEGGSGSILSFQPRIYLHSVWGLRSGGQHQEGFPYTSDVLSPMCRKYQIISLVPNMEILDVPKISFLSIKMSCISSLFFGIMKTTVYDPSTKATGWSGAIWFSSLIYTDWVHWGCRGWSDSPKVTSR